MLEDIKSALTPALPAPDPTLFDVDKDLNEELFEKYGRPSDHLREGNLNQLKTLDSHLKRDVASLNGPAVYDLKSASLRDDVVKYRKAIKDVIKALKQYKVQQQGKSITTTIMTTMNDLVERMKILLGEIESGNTNKVLKNDLRDIAHYLYSKDKINKSTYKMLMSFTI